MPPTIQLYVRSALLYLLASAVLGLLWQIDLWLHWFQFSGYVRTVHAHLALMGGVVQMIMGVALWMFPLTQPLPERLPFRPGLAVAAWALFNGGLLGRFVVESAFRVQGGDLYGALTVLTGVLQVLAMALFIYHLWWLRRSRRTP